MNENQCPIALLCHTNDVNYFCSQIASLYEFIPNMLEMQRPLYYSMNLPSTYKQLLIQLYYVLYLFNEFILPYITFIHKLSQDKLYKWIRLVKLKHISIQPYALYEGFFALNLHFMPIKDLLDFMKETLRFVKSK